MKRPPQRAAWKKIAMLASRQYGHVENQKTELGVQRGTLPNGTSRPAPRAEKQKTWLRSRARCRSFAVTFQTTSKTTPRRKPTCPTLKTN